MHGRMISLNGFFIQIIMRARDKIQNAFRFNTETSIQFNFDLWKRELNNNSCNASIDFRFDFNKSGVNCYSESKIRILKQ